MILNYKMANKKYNLNIDDFDTVVASFSEASDIEYAREDIGGNIIYRFKKKGEKRFCSVLTCFISVGRTSFGLGGKDSSIAEKCQEQLIENTVIKVGESRSFTIKPASEEDIDTVCDFLCEECECIKEELNEANITIHSSFEIIGKYKDSIHFTHYNTGTLLVQGRPCMTFNSFISIAVELFNPSEVKKEHLKMFDIEVGDTVIDTNLSTNIPHAYEHIGEKLDAIMAPSLILLNNAKELTDYSAYAFPVLRGSEGVLKKIFNEDGILVEKDFREYFYFDKSKGTCQWAKDKDCTVFFPNGELRKSLLDLYRFYHEHRHTLFHVDATIDTTRTLEYEEAIDIVKSGLSLIDNIYIHLN